jgi:DNA-binding IclR family transcriptional regulator
MSNPEPAAAAAGAGVRAADTMRHLADGKEASVAESARLNESVRAVDRALEILLAFTAEDDELTVGELLKRVDLSRPTLYRLLYTLEQSGFVISVGDPQKFRLGPSVGRLAHAWASSLDVGAMAQPILQSIREATGETVALFVPQGGWRLCIAELPSAQPLSFKRGIGYRERLFVGASGRAILAHMADGEKLLHQYTREAGLDPEKYLKELKAVLQRGYAVSKSELIQGAVAIAAPFFDSAGRVAGSIAVFGPSVRLNASQSEALGKQLLLQAQALSAALGHG